MLADSYRITDVQKVSWNGRPMLAFTAFQRKGNAFVCAGRFTASRKIARRDLWKIVAHMNADHARR